MDEVAHFISALPAFWQNQLLGTFVAPGSTFSIYALALTLTAAALFVVRGRAVAFKTLVRVVFPRRIWRTRSGRADIAWFAFSVFGGGSLFAWAIIASLGVNTGTADLLTQIFGAPSPTLLPAGIVMALVTISLFIAYEFAYWLDHWAMHHFKPAWAFHQVHHSAESLSLLTIARVHPIETIGFYNLVAIIMGVTGGLMTYMFGGNASPVLLYGSNALILLGGVLITHLQHSHLWITFGPVWGRVLLGPAHHQIHHSDDPTHHNRNFGNFLTVFDRMFGSFEMPGAKRGDLTFGIGPQAQNPHSLYAMIITPCVQSWKLAYKSLIKAFAPRAIVAPSAHAGERT